MRNSRRNKSYSRISNRILTNLVLSCMVLLIVLLGGYFIAWMICNQFTWQADNPLYWILKVVQALSPVIIVVSSIVGVLLLARASIKKPLMYLDEVIDASTSLAHPTEELIELPDELGVIQNELNLAREQALRNQSIANEAVQRKNDLVMYLAHDLKTPLASVIGYLTLLRDEADLPADMREKYLSISLDKAERLEELIDEFFEISRFNLSNITLQYSHINLTRLLEQLTFEFLPMLKEKSLTCNLHVDPDIMIDCDADKMQRVFDNLLRNAVLYSHEGTEIDITVSERYGGLSVRFLNRGDTIPKEKLERIFEQFYRLDASRSTKGGAGLGLAIAKQIVELHGGTISARSESGIIEFEVLLPFVGKS